MAFDMHEVQITGRLAADPAGNDNKSGNGRNVRCRVAVTTGKDRESGEEQTAWINATAFGNQGKVLEDYAHKGDKIAMAGRFSLREYQAQTGETRTSFDLEVTSVTLLQPKAANGGGNGNGNGSVGAGSGARRPAPARQVQPEWDNDEEIPF